MYTVMQELLGVQVDNYAKLNSLSKGVPPRIYNEDLNRRLYITEAYAEYKLGGDLSNYLCKVGKKMRGKKV